MHVIMLKKVLQKIEFYTKKSKAMPYTEERKLYIFSTNALYETFKAMFTVKI